MSIVGTSWHDLEEWNADKKKIISCQESIECQRRTIRKVETYVSFIRQTIGKMGEKLDKEKQDFLRQNASLNERVNRLSTRMDELEKLQSTIAQRNNDTAAVIQQLINQKAEEGESGNDLYNEATAQFVLMEYNPYYLKFAGLEINALRARIEQGKTTDWTATTMQAIAVRLLSDVYLAGLKVAEARKQYEVCQQQCVQKATTILEQANEFRENGVIYGYAIGRDVDYWTNGALKSVEQKVQGILDEIASKVNDPDFQISNLNDLMMKLTELAQEKDKIIDCAMDNARHSERTQAEVRHAVELLDNYDFRLVGANYEMGDERRPFIARMRRDTDGMEIEFVCGYDSTTGQYKLAYSMNSQAYNDPNVRDAIERDLTQSLIDVGLQITSNQTCEARDLTEYDGNNPVVDAETNAQLKVSPLGYN